MPLELVKIQQDFFRELLECIAVAVPVPIGLYQKKNDKVEEVIPESSRANYVNYCKLIQSFKGGKQQCEKNQMARAKKAFESNQDKTFDCCWAGVYNESRLIKIDEKPVSLLVYGGGKIKARTDKGKSIERNEEAIKFLQLNKEQASKLRTALKEIADSPISKEDFQKVKDVFVKATLLISVLEENQNQVRYIAERNSHEVATRLQVLIAESENFVSQIEEGDTKEAVKTAHAVLHSAESLATVTQNLGNYLEDYRFKRQSLYTLVSKSIKTYESEAKRKEIDIKWSLYQPYELEFSKNHLEYALNNLIHNAIKYSFRGSKQYERFMKVDGQPELRFYRLKITNYGIGILPEEFENIFIDGFQGRLTENEYRTGSGKGLSFVKRIIEEHNGTIQVESVPQSDSTAERKPYLTKFIVRLPYSQPK
jgi:signal transduction histidine kinase